jgi:precorrin-3B C17-methyltransferase
MEVHLKLYVVGLGPGEASQITNKALEALENSDLIVGYGVYIDLIKPLILDKETLTTPMKKEVERCKMAVQAAISGKNVSMVSSGDAGIYGMAGLIYEALAEYPANAVEVEVIPGITAAASAAAILGAPLMQDFAVISLSDLLTPWEDIEKRIQFAAQAGFVICIYNPSSKKRWDHLKKACELAMESLDKSTPCGFVQNIGREGQRKKLLTLEGLADTQVDMFTTVIIGNKNTRVINGKLVTSRGYRV